MPITDYASLQASIGNWLHRGDLTSVIPDFIMLFEQEANRRLRVRQQIIGVTLTVTNSQATLPTDYLVWRNVVWNPASTPYATLEYVTPTARSASDAGVSGGTPKRFTISGANVIVSPPADGQIAFSYYAEIPPLSVSATTNWLLTAHPDVYLFGSLAESQGYAKNPDEMAGWMARRDVILEEIITLDNKSKGVGPIKLIGIPTP